MAEEAIRYRITADGAEATARAFERVAGSQRSANDQFAKLSTTASKAATTFAALGGALGRLDPQLGAIGASFGRATGAISAMSSVLGGPWGIAIGAGITALGILSETLRETTSAQDELTESTKKGADAFARQAEAVIAFANSDEARRMYDMRLRGLRDSGFFESVTTAGGAFGDEEWQKRNAAELGRINELERGGGFDEGGGGAARRYDPFDVMQRRDANNRQIARLNAMENGGGLRAGDRGALDAKAEENAAFLEQHRQFREDLLDADRQYADANAKLTEELAKKWDVYRSAGIDAATGIERVSISGLQKIAKGQKFTTTMLLSAIGDEMVAGGSKWVAEGTGRAIASYGTDPTAWGLIGLGGAEIAFGLGLGAATSGFNGGGGAGGRSRPMAPISSGGGGGSQEPKTVNVYMPTVVSPSAQDGIRVRQALQEAGRAGL